MKPISPPFVTSSSSGRCCSTGHPVLADPLTGRTVCSCKLQTGVPAYLSRVPSLPENVYARSSMEHLNKLSVISEQNRSPYYQKFPVEKHTTGINTATPGVHPYYLEHMMAAHPYGAMYPGFDINGNRRKNASKESTGPLKAWLYQHRKNPYPTKGEKVMLAIISQMTLTQVSTWFANARRRLKKESKMADKDVDLSDLDIDDTGMHNDSFSSHVTDSDIESPVSVGNISKSSPEHSDISDSESHQESGDQKSNSACAQRLFSPEGRTEHHFDRSSSPTEDNKFNLSLTNDKNSVSDSKSCNKDLGMYQKDTNTPTRSSSLNGNQQKTKIWSIAEMLG